MYFSNNGIHVPLDYRIPEIRDFQRPFFENKPIKASDNFPRNDITMRTFCNLEALLAQLRDPSVRGRSVGISQDLQEVHSVRVSREHRVLSRQVHG